VKRELIKAALLEDAARSDRAIAKLGGVSHHTVADIRAPLEATGQIAQLEKRTGSDGRKRRSPARPEISEAERLAIRRDLRRSIRDMDEAAVAAHRRKPKTRREWEIAAGLPAIEAEVRREAAEGRLGDPLPARRSTVRRLPPRPDAAPGPAPAQEPPVSRDQLVAHLFGAHDGTFYITSRTSRAQLAEAHRQYHDSRTFRGGGEHEHRDQSAPSPRLPTPASEGERVRRRLSHPELDDRIPVSRAAEPVPSTARRPGRRSRGPCRGCGASLAECAIEAGVPCCDQCPHPDPFASSR